MNSIKKKEFDCSLFSKKIHMNSLKKSLKIKNQKKFKFFMCKNNRRTKNEKRKSNIKKLNHFKH